MGCRLVHANSHDDRPRLASSAQCRLARGVSRAGQTQSIFLPVTGTASCQQSRTTLVWICRKAMIRPTSLPERPLSQEAGSGLRSRLRHHHRENRSKANPIFRLFLHRLAVADGKLGNSFGTGLNRLCHNSNHTGFASGAVIPSRMRIGRRTACGSPLGRT